MIMLENHIALSGGLFNLYGCLFLAPNDVIKWLKQIAEHAILSRKTFGQI